MDIRTIRTIAAMVMIGTIANTQGPVEIDLITENINYTNVLNFREVSLEKEFEKVVAKRGHSTAGDESLKLKQIEQGVRLETKQIVDPYETIRPIWHRTWTGSIAISWAYAAIDEGRVERYVSDIYAKTTVSVENIIESIQKLLTFSDEMEAIAATFDRQSEQILERLQEWEGRMEIIRPYKAMQAHMKVEMWEAIKICYDNGAIPAYPVLQSDRARFAKLIRQTWDEEFYVWLNLQHNGPNGVKSYYARANEPIVTWQPYSRLTFMNGTLVPVQFHDMIAREEVLVIVMNGRGEETVIKKEGGQIREGRLQSSFAGPCHKRFGAICEMPSKTTKSKQGSGRVSVLEVKKTMEQVKEVIRMMIRTPLEMAVHFMEKTQSTLAQAQLYLHLNFDPVTNQIINEGSGVRLITHEQAGMAFTIPEEGLTARYKRVAIGAILGALGRFAARVGPYAARAGGSVAQAARAAPKLFARTGKWIKNNPIKVSTGLAGTGATVGVTTWQVLETKKLAKQLKTYHQEYDNMTNIMEAQIHDMDRTRQHLMKMYNLDGRRIDVMNEVRNMSRMLASRRINNLREVISRIDWIDKAELGMISVLAVTPILESAINHEEKGVMQKLRLIAGLIDAAVNEGNVINLIEPSEIVKLRGVTVGNENTIVKESKELTRCAIEEPQGEKQLKFIFAFPAVENKKYKLMTLMGVPRLMMVGAHGAPFNETTMGMFSPKIRHNKIMLADTIRDEYYALTDSEYIECKRTGICRPSNKIAYEVKDTDCAIRFPRTNAEKGACPGVRRRDLNKWQDIVVNLGPYLIYSVKEKIEIEKICGDQSIGREETFYGSGVIKVATGCLLKGRLESGANILLRGTEKGGFRGDDPSEHDESDITRLDDNGILMEEHNVGSREKRSAKFGNFDDSEDEAAIESFSFTQSWKDIQELMMNQVFPMVDEAEAKSSKSDYWQNTAIIVIAAVLLVLMAGAYGATVRLGTMVKRVVETLFNGPKGLRECANRRRKRQNPINEPETEMQLVPNTDQTFTLDSAQRMAKTSCRVQVEAQDRSRQAYEATHMDFGDSSSEISGDLTPLPKGRKEGRKQRK